MTLSLISSRKHLAVASTSAEALWASANSSPNNLKCNSDRFGHLYLPPLPPESAQYSVEWSLVSIAGNLANRFGIDFLNNSHPIILLSKLTLCPITNFDFSTSITNSLRTVARSTPFLFAVSVEIPCIFSALKGIS